MSTKQSTRARAASKRLKRSFARREAVAT